MRILFEPSARRTLAWAAAVIFAVALAGQVRPATAGGDVIRRGAEGSEHNSLIRITSADALPQVRAVRIGKNKSLLVELPVDLRDVMVSAPEIVDAVVQSAIDADEADRMSRAGQPAAAQ